MYIKLATRFFLRTIIIALLLVLFSETEAQLQYSFERINTDNGLPTNAIKGLQFDDKTREYLTQFLKRLGYSDKVIIDEYQAYRYTEPANFFGIKLY